MSDACKQARSVINNQDLIIRLGYHGTLKIIKFYAFVWDRDSIIPRLTRINAHSPIIKLRMLSPQTILTRSSLLLSSIYSQLGQTIGTFVNLSRRLSRILFRRVRHEYGYAPEEWSLVRLASRGVLPISMNVPTFWFQVSNHEQKLC